MQRLHWVAAASLYATLATPVQAQVKRKPIDRPAATYAATSQLPIAALPNGIVQLEVDGTEKDLLEMLVVLSLWVA